MAKALYVGVDVGGTKISAALVRSDGKILAREKTSTPKGAGPKRILRVIEGIVRDAVSEGGRKLKDLRGIGVGAPGIVEPEGGRILAAPNIDLEGVPVAAKLRKRLGVGVILGNDVNLGTLGEQWLGAGKGAENVVAIFPGTGVGGGAIVAGKLMLGAHGAAAELGHIVVDPMGPACGCGNRGCLEALASRGAIEREIRRAIRSGEKSIVTELAAGRLDVIKSKVIAKALKRKDPLVTRVVRRASEALGSACVTLRHAFDPELFVFGGGLIEACGDFILPVVRKSLEGDPLFRKVPACRAVPSRLGDDAVILGAVALAKETF